MDFLKLDKLSYVVIFGASVLNFIVGLIEPTIGPYLEIIGATKPEIGSILSARWFIVAFGSIPFALLASRFGHIKILVISAASGLLAMVFLTYLDGTRAVLYFYVLMGVATASAAGPGAAILAENQGSKRIAAFSLFTVARMLPPAAGAGISYWWFENSGKDTLASSIFGISLILTLIGITLYILMLFWYRSLEPNKEEGIPVIRQFRIIFLPIVALPITLLITTNFIMGAGAGASLPYLPLYMAYIGADNAMLSLLALGLNLAMGLATLFTPTLSSYFGDLKVFVIGTVLSVVCLVTLVYTQDLVFASVLFMLRGMFANMTSPIITSRVVSYIDPSVRATGSALATNIRWLGWVIFSPISGELIENYGYQLPFIITSILYLVATILFIFVNIRIPNLEEIRHKDE
ncbi:MAG: MFS transporter [Candidatus Heimdallarchaeota archaeon]|nr:MFS transporter [Candidatus Heimdallarchaeota archaeon]